MPLSAPSPTPDPRFSDPRLAQVYDLVDGDRSDLTAYRARVGELGGTLTAGVEGRQLGEGLTRLGGYPFEVRHSAGALERARVAADLAADAYRYLAPQLSGFEPDIAVIVADRPDWQSRQPYGLPFFNDEAGQIRQGILVMPATRGDFWVAMGDDLRDASPRGYSQLLATYPDGQGGLDLQPFFDLVTIHELGHAFEALGGLGLPTFWLGELFANLVLHAFIATRRPEALGPLEVLASVGAGSRRLAARMRAHGYSSLEELEAHYTGGERPMSPLNYVWYQYRFQRLAARMFQADGEQALVRFWAYFHDGQGQRLVVGAPSLTSALGANVSATLGRAIQNWR